MTIGALLYILLCGHDPLFLFLILNNGTSLRLYTDSFTEGTPEDCLRLLHA